MPVGSPICIGKPQCGQGSSSPGITTGFRLRSSFCDPKHLNELAGMASGRDLAIFACELAMGLLSLSLASLGWSAIAELAGPALEFPSVIERMMLPKFLGRLKAE
jgi:hypothetical protein